MQTINTEVDNDALIVHTAEIVTSFVASNTVSTDKVSDLIASVHEALSGLGAEPPKEKPEPAVPIKKSIRPDYVVCLDCGRKMKMLKRHLNIDHDLTPSEYRDRWNLPDDYPLVAPNYAERRRDLAKDIGLGKISKTSKSRNKAK